MSSIAYEFVDVPVCHGDSVFLTTKRGMRGKSGKKYPSIPGGSSKRTKGGRYAYASYHKWPTNKHKRILRSIEVSSRSKDDDRFPREREILKPHMDANPRQMLKSEAILRRSQKRADSSGSHGIDVRTAIIETNPHFKAYKCKSLLFEFFQDDWHVLYMDAEYYDNWYGHTYISPGDSVEDVMDDLVAPYF